MKTKQTYYEDSYKKELNTKVSNVIKADNLCKLVLEETIAYPSGGGQPSDKGIIISNGKTEKLTKVLIEDGEIHHYVDGDIEYTIGQEVEIQLDWDLRYKNMQVHTAGHIIDYALYNLGLSGTKMIAQRADHGRKPWIEYKGKLSDIDVDKLKDEIESIISKDIKLTSEDTDFDNLKSKAIWLQDNLPTNRKLRMLTFEGIGSVADGGVLVGKTSEILGIEITSIDEKDDGSIRIKYQVNFDTPTEQKPNSDEKKHDSSLNFDKLIKDFNTDLDNAKTLDNINDLKVKYLGRKSELILALRNIKNLPNEEKAYVGKKGNETRKDFEDRCELKLEEVKKNEGKINDDKWIDVTVPRKEHKGSLHPTTQMKWRVEDIFQKMGFEVIDPYELDDDYHTFTALNIPEGHPARDMWDTFWTEQGNIPITHTSAMQNRIMKNNTPPIRAIVPGKCFRNEATDASHEFVFYQVEGVYIDKGITFADMIGTLQEFLRNFYGKDIEMGSRVFSSNTDKIETRIQPSFFPFVEPAIEIMIKWKFGDTYKWLEVIPCGPIHPSVLREGGLDPEVYSGFAWGFGLERLMMIKYEIEDIRNFHGGDLRFLKQF